MFWECQPFSCSVGEHKLMKHSFENTRAATICASVTTLCSVIPAQAGIHPPSRLWMPAYAGMTSLRNEPSGGGFRYFHYLWACVR